MKPGQTQACQPRKFRLQCRASLFSNPRHPPVHPVRKGIPTSRVPVTRDASRAKILAGGSRKVRPQRSDVSRYKTCHSAAGGKDRIYRHQKKSNFDRFLSQSFVNMPDDLRRSSLVYLNCYPCSQNHGSVESIPTLHMK